MMTVLMRRATTRLIALLALTLFPFGQLLAGEPSAPELKVPEPFDVLVVNGTEFGASLQRIKTVPLAVGRNVIVVEYDQIFDAEFGDSHDRIQSAPMALVFDASAGMKLELVDPQIGGNADARKYATAPSLRLQDSHGAALTFKQLPVRELNGMLLADGSTPPAPPTMYPQPAATVPSVAGSASAASTPEHNPVPNALDMLRFWWQQASPEQRAEFLQQINSVVR